VIERLQSLYKGGVRQLVRYSLVGASGVLVNLLVAYIAKKTTPLVWASATDPNNYLFQILGTRFHVRWFWLFTGVAFVVANLSNYQLNRVWSFRSKHHAGWFRELVPFFTVGLLAQAVGFVPEWALMNPTSPISLSDIVFDNSSGFRTKYYWAHLVGIAVTIPVSFLLNKYWTFGAIRNKPEDAAEPAEEPAAPEEGG